MAQGDEGGSVMSQEIRLALTVAAIGFATPFVLVTATNLVLAVVAAWRLRKKRRGER